MSDPTAPSTAAAPGPTTTVPLPSLADKLTPHVPGAEPFTSRDGIEGVSVPVELLADAARRVRDNHGFIRFIDLTVVDEPDQEDRFELQILLYSMNEQRWLRLKARTSERAPSLTPIFVAAHNYEREAYDLFGVVFEGHPSLTRIMMPDGWQGHPLRKDDGLFNEPVDFTVTRDTFQT